MLKLAILPMGGRVACTAISGPHLAMPDAARVPRAMVLGGNGQVGRAAALKLVSSGWQVTSSGQAETRFPQDLRDAECDHLNWPRLARFPHSST